MSTPKKFEQESLQSFIAEMKVKRANIRESLPEASNKLVGLVGIINACMDQYNDGEIPDEAAFVGKLATKMLMIEDELKTKCEGEPIQNELCKQIQEYREEMLQQFQEKNANTNTSTRSL